MNTAVASAEILLKASREVAAEKGIGAISIRNVAQRAQVSVGSVYNYFENKEMLVSETIVSIWCDILKDAEDCRRLSSFHDSLLWLVGMIDKCGREYPDILTAHPHSIRNKRELEKSRIRMEQYIAHIEEQLKYVLEHDKKVRPGIFDDSFTEDEFIEFIFSNVVLGARDGSQNISVLMKLVDKVLY